MLQPISFDSDLTLDAHHTQIRCDSESGLFIHIYATFTIVVIGITGAVNGIELIVIGIT